MKIYVAPKRRRYFEGTCVSVGMQGIEIDSRKRERNFTRITAELFVGDIHAASDGKLLLSHGITGVISAVPGVAEDYKNVKKAVKSAGGAHLVLGLEDSPCDSLAPHLDTVFKFLSLHKPALVHCIAGISRSCALIVAYLLMVDSGRSLKNTLNEIRTVHSIADPAPWFMAELGVIEMGGRLMRGLSSCHQNVDAPLWLRVKATNRLFESESHFSCACARLRCRKCRSDLAPSCTVFGRYGNLFLLARWVKPLDVGARCQCRKCGGKLGTVSKATWIDGVPGGVGDVTLYTLTMSKIDWPLDVDLPKQTTMFKL